MSGKMPRVRARDMVDPATGSEDPRNAEDRVIDTAFEALIRRYTKSREFEVVRLVNVLYGKVLADREV